MRIAVLTSGGDAPGMNAAIRAVVRTAVARGWSVLGVRNGYAGLMGGEFIPLGARNVGGILERGGTVLGSARAPEFAERGRADAGAAQAQDEQVDALVVIGGNGSQCGAAALSARGLPVVGVASTIDNDLFGTDITIGVDTALNVALEAIDRLKVTGSSHGRGFVVETMGRDCGYLALMAGLAGRRRDDRHPRGADGARRGGRGAAQGLRAREGARHHRRRRGRAARRRGAGAVLPRAPRPLRLRAAAHGAGPRAARRHADLRRPAAGDAARGRRGGAARAAACTACSWVSCATRSTPRRSPRWRGRRRRSTRACSSSRGCSLSSGPPPCGGGGAPAAHARGRGGRRGSGWAARRPREIAAGAPPPPRPPPEGTRTLFAIPGGLLGGADRDDAQVARRHRTARTL